MKRILLIALAMIAIIGCSKNEDNDKPIFTQEQMEGRWKWVDTRLPDGKLFSQLLPPQEYQSRLNDFITLRNNTAFIESEIETFSATYKLIGNTMQITINGKTFNMFDIVKRTKERVELKIHNDYKKVKKAEGGYSGIPGYSVDQLLDAILIFDKAD